MNARADRFPLFDSLRAIACLSVLGAHAAFFAGFGRADEPLRPYAARLDVGVRIFFLISAFLLYRPFVVARLRGEAGPRTRPYAWRRFLRIAPAYWVALTAVALWFGQSSIFSLDRAPLYYGFAHVYDRSTLTLAGIPQAWSLCVEVAFYAFLPLYAAIQRRWRTDDAGRRLRRELAGAAVLFATSLAFKGWILAHAAPTSSRYVTLHFTLLEFLDLFAMGMALAALSAWYATKELPAALRPLDRWPSLAWLAAAAAFILVSGGIGLNGDIAQAISSAQYLGRHYLYGIIAVGVLLPAIFGDPRRGLVRRFLSSRLLLYIGLVSYGIYLVHFAVLTQLRSWKFDSVAAASSRWLWFPVALIGSLLLATVSYYVLERPILRLRNLVADPVRSAQVDPREPAPASPPQNANLESAGP